MVIRWVAAEVGLLMMWYGECESGQKVKVLWPPILCGGRQAEAMLMDDWYERLSRRCESKEMK